MNARNVEASGSPYPSRRAVSLFWPRRFAQHPSDALEGGEGALLGQWLEERATACRVVKAKAKITVVRTVKAVHPVAQQIAENLAAIDAIRFVKMSLELLRASSEVSEGRLKTPVTKPGHPTAIGVSLIFHAAYKTVQFYEITSATKGYGSKMVDAVLRALPEGWSGVVVMDWSDGFWKRMSEKYENLEVV